ncbi:hypothetical protein BT63DRAFT_191651 [Microthyrium microscopicum]|uniref:Methyltransferase type 11 domain-containing protein n=1 Tax=Microthyrium microscopicum TaxID=703497 RepID=A0A6A6UJ23_9PEZI|nr:hypothetical protein BT63DRAFT_191651 [Microthyrium microscopicum]
MFAADLSWKETTEERVGERRQRKARQASTTPAGNTSSSSGPSSVSSSQPGHRNNHTHSKPFSERISSAFKRPRLNGKKKKPITPEKPVFKIERVPTLLQQKDREPVYFRGQSPFALSTERLENQPGPVYQDFAQSFNPAISTDSVLLERGLRDLRLLAENDANELCQSYDDVKERILALQSSQSTPVQEQYPERYSPLSLQHPSPEASTIGESVWESDSQYQERETRNVRICSPSKPRIIDYTPKTPSRSKNHEFPAVLDYVAPQHQHMGRTHSPMPPSFEYNDQYLQPPPPMPQTSWEMVRTEAYPSASSPATLAGVSSPLSNINEVREWQATPTQALTSNADHFLRLVRRMETANPKVILDRLCEDWRSTADPVVRDEMQLEKQLWTIYAAEHSILDRFSRTKSSRHPITPSASLTQCRNIIELDGNIAELYHVANIHPDARIVHLVQPASHPDTHHPLPPTATQHTLPTITYPTAYTNTYNTHPTSYPSTGYSPPPATHGISLSLPYAARSVHHIHAARLPSLLPAAHLPALVADCRRVLKPTGTLELRLVDAIPDRGSTGPRLATWLEQHLLPNLERDLRCLQPTALLPNIAQSTGFPGPLQMTRHLRLPAAIIDTNTLNSGHSNGAYSNGAAITGSDVLAHEIGTMVLRELWKDSWGAYVSVGEAGVLEWWWEDSEILEECVEWGTGWDVGVLIAVKEDEGAEERAGREF